MTLGHVKILNLGFQFCYLYLFCTDNLTLYYTLAFCTQIVQILNGFYVFYFTTAQLAFNPLTLGGIYLFLVCTCLKWTQTLFNHDENFLFTKKLKWVISTWPKSNISSINIPKFSLEINVFKRSFKLWYRKVLNANEIKLVDQHFYGYKGCLCYELIAIKV